MEQLHLIRTIQIVVTYAILIIKKLDTFAIKMIKLEPAVLMGLHITVVFHLPMCQGHVQIACLLIFITQLVLMHTLILFAIHKLLLIMLITTRKLSLLAIYSTIRTLLVFGHFIG